MTGAIVPVSQCVADVHAGSGTLRFPAVLTEKYLKHEQLEPYAINIIITMMMTHQIHNSLNSIISQRKLG